MVMLTMAFVFIAMILLYIVIGAVLSIIGLTIILINKLTKRKTKTGLILLAIGMCILLQVFLLLVRVYLPEYL